MKWAREIKVGILAIVVIIVLIWGYQFLKGKNVFGNEHIYKIVYHQIDQLTTSSPVMVRGFKVGMVTNIYLNPENIDEIIVEVQVDGKIGLPKDTRAILYSVGIVGGKGIILDYEKACSEDCIEDGGFITGETRGLLSSMVPESDIDLYLSKLQSGLDGVLDSMGLDTGGEGDAASTPDQLKEIVANLASITASLDKVIARSDAHITQSLADIQSFTGSLKENEQHLNTLMTNLDVISTQLATSTLPAVDTTFGDLSATVEELKSVVGSADNSFRNIDQIITKVEQGEGTLGKLVAQDSLYNELSLTLSHLNLLLQDLRLNPKRYVNVSVIGRKQESYEKPENDPAFGDE